MTLRVPVKPEFFTWAIEYSNKDPNTLARKFKKLSEWIQGNARPTFKQLEEFSKATYVPFGYFFLDELPEENIPIPDLRTMGNKEIDRPSPDLLDTIYLCQQRQDWHRDFLLASDGEPLKFVGSVNISDSIEETAEKMRKALGFSLQKRNTAKTWEESLRLFVEEADNIGIMVMINGVVGSNNKRKLDVEEFRGFALHDEFSPLIFINGADSKSAQMFTLAHELAHIWLGQSAVSDTTIISMPSNKTEIWCNKIAAEFLVPLKVLKNEDIGVSPLKAVPELTRTYKVSSLVIIRRLFDAKYITRKEFDKAYKQELRRLQKFSQGGGGDFYRTLSVRNGKRFIRNVIVATLEGQTQFSEAFRLLGIKKMQTFDEIGRQLGVIVI